MFNNRWPTAAFVSRTCSRTTTKRRALAQPNNFTVNSPAAWWSSMLVQDLIPTHYRLSVRGSRATTTYDNLWASRKSRKLPSKNPLSARTVRSHVPSGRWAKDACKNGIAPRADPMFPLRCKPCRMNRTSANTASKGVMTVAAFAAGIVTLACPCLVSLPAEHR